MDLWFLALDGDDVGRRLELYVVTNDKAGLSSFTASFKRTLSELLDSLDNIPDVEVILGGGDSVLLQIPRSKILTAITAIRTSTKETGFTFSGGYGPSMREAYLALKLAKATGKNKIVTLHPGEASG